MSPALLIASADEWSQDGSNGSGAVVPVRVTVTPVNVPSKRPLPAMRPAALTSTGVIEGSRNTTFLLSHSVPCFSL